MSNPQNDEPPEPRRAEEHDPDEPPLGGSEATEGELEADIAVEEDTLRERPRRAELVAGPSPGRPVISRPYGSRPACACRRRTA